MFQIAPRAHDQSQRALVPLDPPATTHRRHNLRGQPSSLVGREAELRCVQTMLERPDVRLVTLTGPAGVGKSRLAIAVAERLLEDEDQRVFFVDLATVADAAGVLPAIAGTLGMELRPAQAVMDSLRAALQDRPPLLVLDNFEHVLAAADQVAELLAGCPALKVLATSRSALQVRWEHELRLRPLDLPPLAHDPDPDTLARSTAVELFVKRSQAVDPGFVLTAGNARAVTEICARLDGLPLAIELAATRNRLLPPAALATGLDQPLDLLTDGPRDLPPRQQSLRAALAWSYDLLDAQEQWLLRQLAVFEGSFSLAACLSVCCSDPSSAPTASSFRTLRRLLEKSLVERDEPSPLDEPRFRLLHTTRHFAREQLSASGEEEPARQRHAEYFVGLAVAADAELLGPDQQRAVTRLELELDNARAALHWLARTGPADLELRLATALAGYWRLRGRLEEGSRTLGAALARGAAASAAIRAAAQAAASSLALARGDWTSAARLAESCLEVSDQAGNRAARCAALACLAVARLRLGDRVRARAAARESLDLARDLGQPDLLIRALQHLAEVTLALGNDDLALSHYTESLRVAHDVGDAWRAARALEGLAVTLAQQGRGRLALRLAGAAAGLRDDLGAPLPPAERDRLDASLAAARDALGEEPASRAESEGRAAPLEQLVREVGELDAGAVAADGAPALNDRIPLSRREREVALLVARGYSNRQIAERLSISPRTAGVHVGNILGKLALDSRTQLASWLLRKGLPG